MHEPFQNVFTQLKKKVSHYIMFVIKQYFYNTTHYKFLIYHIKILKF